MTTQQNALNVAPSLRGELRFPEGDEPSITSDRIYRADAPVASFGAPSWPLAALDVGSRPTRTLHFADWPEGFQNFARHVAYVLINYGNPEGFMEQRGSSAVQWPSGASIDNILQRLRAQTRWLTTDWSERHSDTPVVCPGDMDQQHLDDLKTWVLARSPIARTQRAHLADALRVWHINPWLPDDCQWPEPAWRHHDWRPKESKSDNKTITIDESTFSPLLEWAIGFVTNFATDIIGAHEHYTERLVSESQATERLAAGHLLDKYARAGMPLPPRPAGFGGREGNGVGWQVLQYRHGLPPKSLSSVFIGTRKKSLQIGADLALTALDTPICGEFRGDPWIQFIGVYDVATGAGLPVGSAGPLVKHLRTASLIVVAALTGMRPEEVLDLQQGCADAPIPRAGGSRVQLIRGHVLKRAVRLEDGSPSEPRVVAWATVPVAAEAIRVAEQINKILGRGAGLLFGEGGPNSVHTGTATGWIESFIGFVNTRLVPFTQNPAAYHISTDPDGAVTLRRFRRTLAWFLRNRPNGDVTTAIQFQHVGVALGEGYAGTKASGMPDLLLEEDWNHRVSTVRHLGDLLDAGEGISGPAAQRVIEATQRLPRLLLPSDERRLRKDKSLPVYDNPAAIALCYYEEQGALCQKLKQTGKDTQPDLLGCVDGCHNCARTDGHLAGLRRQTQGLRDQAALAPKPLAQSMLARAHRNEKIVAEFGEQRITLNDTSFATSQHQHPHTHD